MARIVTAADHAKREGAKTVKGRIQARCGNLVRAGMLKTPFKDVRPVEPVVLARIDFSQWVADCECGGAEAVDPNEPIFYCFSCGNRATKGMPRKVVFPDQATIAQIEALLMERPVDDSRGLDDIDQAFKSRPLVSEMVDGELRVYSRSWSPNETVDDLKAQNSRMKKVKGAK